jgi:hypothetical protein
VVAGLDAKGCKADEGGVCRFIKRFETKPYGIGQRPEPEAGHPHPGADPEVHARKEEPEPPPVSKHSHGLFATQTPITIGPIPDLVQEVVSAEATPRLWPGAPFQSLG